MEKSLVSIIMACYNHAQYLEQSIGSVISQGYKNWELIIVDDGSLDASLKVAEKYTKDFPDKIRLYTHADRKNLGISASYRLGLEHCRGEFVAFLEPDDFWDEDNLRLKIAAFLKKDVGLVYSDVRPIGDAQVIAMRALVLRNISTLPERIPFSNFKKLLVMNYVPTFSTAIIRQEILRDLRFISDRRYEMWLDWFFWIQASLVTKFFFIPEKLVNWRLYKESFFNKFLVTKGTINIIIFDVEYRIMLVREIILLPRVNVNKKIAILFNLSHGFLKRIGIFVSHQLLKKR